MQNFVSREELTSMTYDKKTLQKHMQTFVSREEMESMLIDKNAIQRHLQNFASREEIESMLYDKISTADLKKVLSSLDFTKLE